MKKFITGIMFFLLLPALITAQSSDWEKAGLKGRVYNLKVMPVDYDKGGKATARNSEVYNYNGRGLLTDELTVNDATLDFVSVKKYEYNNGLLIKKSTDVKVSILAGVEEEQYSYYPDKKIKEIRILKAETGKIPVKPATVKTFIYDAAGNCTEEKTIAHDYNNMEDILRHSYDASGRKTRTEYIRNRKSWQIISYTYDKNNRVLMQTTSDAEGRSKSSFGHRYDAAGHIIRTEAVEYNYPQATVYSLSITSNVYSSGLKIGSTTEKEGKITFKSVWQYDEFDKQGNWLSCKRIFNDKLDRIEKRRITYF